MMTQRLLTETLVLKLVDTYYSFNVACIVESESITMKMQQILANQVNTLGIYKKSSLCYLFNG